MSGPVKVQSIRIGRMPGIRHEFSLEDLSPGVNILYGPNGVGKTSVGRATVLALFNGSESVWERLVARDGTDTARELRKLEIRTDFVFPGADGTPNSWQVSLDAGTPDSMVNGIRQALSVGSPELAQRYRMGLAELLVESNEEFAREILRQAAGGIDLSAIVKRLRWDSAVARPRDSRDSELRRARTELQRAEAEQANLDKSVAEISALRKEEAELRERQARGRVIDAAIECLEAREEARDLEGRIEEIPEAARRIHADAEGTAKALAERLRAAVGDHQEAGRRLDDHRRLPAKLTPDEIQAKDVDLSTAQARVDELRHAELALATAERDLRGTESHLRSAEAALAAGAITDRDTAERVDADAARDADAIAELVRTARERIRQGQELKIQFEASAWVTGIDESGLPGSDALHRGLDALTEWCKAVDPSPVVGSPNAGAGPPLPPWTWPALVALALASLALATLVDPAAAIGLPAVALAAWLAWRGRAAGGPAIATGSDLPGIQAKFERLSRDMGIPMPEAWTLDAVGARIDQLMDRLAKRIRIDAAKPIRARLLELERQGRSAEEVALAKCREFEGRHRIALVRDGGLPTEGWMPLMVRAIAAWRHAAHESRAAEHLLKLAEERATERRGELQRELERVGLAGKIGSQRLTADLGERLLAGLADRRKAFAGAAHEGENLVNQLERSEQRRRDAEANVGEFWEDLGLPAGDLGGLQRRIDANREFRDLSTRLEAVRAREKDRLRDLGPGSELLDLGRDALQRERGTLAGLDDRIASINQKVGEIEGRVRTAVLRHDVSAGQLAVRRANEELLQRERAWAAAQVRDQVIAWARESMQQGVVTPVVERSKRLLADFTRGELDFEVREGEAGDKPSLRARSTSSPEWRTVDRLSSGERIQLLMAVRFAFLEESEERMLPIFLDEVLGSSDDERARCIIDAVIAIAATGRQVFYATAQADEVAKWRSRLDGGDIDFRIIDVAEARNIARLGNFPLPEPIPAPPPVPEPRGRTHSEYGKVLGVPGVDWSEPGLGSLHPWHVLEDPELLHEVLRQGLSMLEQVERVAAFEPEGPLARARESMRAAACAYRAAGDAWRIGRGIPITRAAIEEADGVSDRFRDRIWAIVQQVGGDARELMRHLRENPPERWRQSSTHELEAWLRSGGYLLDEDPLDPDEIMNRVLEELARRNLRPTTTSETLHRLRGLLGVTTRS